MRDGSTKEKNLKTEKTHKKSTLEAVFAGNQ